MKFYFTVVVLMTVALCEAEQKLEATDGQNVNISLETAKLDRVEQVKITFTGEHVKNNLFAQFCLCEHCEDCNAKHKPGVLLKIEERILILQNVSSNNSGLYKIRVIGEKVYDIKATLVVKKPALSLTEVPPHTTPKPQNSSELHWLCTLLILPVILVVYLFWRRCKKTPASSKKTDVSNCAAVSLKICRGDTEDSLMDT